MSRDLALRPVASGRRLAGTIYGVASYVLFLGTFVYAIGFVADLLVPRSIDGPATGAPLGSALAVDAALLGLFAVQHSGMARQGFKDRLARWLPASLERQTYVLATNVCFWALFVFWQPLPGVVWSVESPVVYGALHALGAAGWLLVLAATCMISHFDLFGMRQTYYHARGKPYPEFDFRVRGLYHLVRHPIQLGFVIAFWATPHMTAGRLLFAVACTAYILVALVLEERDLVRRFGDRYRAYQRQVGQLVPRGRYRG